MSQTYMPTMPAPLMPNPPLTNFHDELIEIYLMTLKKQPAGLTSIEERFLAAFQQWTMQVVVDFKSTKGGR